MWHRYEDEDSLMTKMEKIATKIYRASGVTVDPKVRNFPGSGAHETPDICLSPSCNITAAR